RFVHVIAHEYAHIQQVPAFVDDEHPTVLAGSLMEGAAEFVGELISGDVAYPQFAAWTKGREKELETGFVKDEDSRDLSRWLYNGKGTADRLGDLGYWVGYRIVRSYFEHARNKRQALHDIIKMSDPKAFLGN